MYSLSGREGGREGEVEERLIKEQPNSVSSAVSGVPTVGISDITVKPSLIPDRRRGFSAARQDGRDRDDQRAGPHHPGGGQALRDSPSSHLRPHWGGRLRGESRQC